LGFDAALERSEALDCSMAADVSPSSRAAGEASAQAGIQTGRGEGVPNANHRSTRSFSAILTLLLALIFGMSPFSRAAEEPTKKPLFLPKSPVAAAYVLSRLSNKELIEAPRSEFVYVALLQRAGLERKYRLEALDGLAKARSTDTLTELIKGIAELDKKGEDALPVLRELATMLVQKSGADLAKKRGDLEKLATEGESPLARQAGYAALVTADASIDKAWTAVEAEPAKFADLLLSIPLLRDNSLRAGLYPRLRPLLDKGEAEEVRRAAITAIVAVPGHDAETFNALAALAKAGTQRATAVQSLRKIPRKSWPPDQAEPLLASLLSYLKEVPADQRTGPEAVSAHQLASDLVTLLPSDKAKDASKALRAAGVSVFTIRTLREQMLYDTSLLVVEAGKPVEIILINEDVMPHNLVIVTPGASEEIGKAAEKMQPEPDAQGRLHVPASPKVLQATKMIDPGQQAKLSFTAPTEPGDYQYVCTFPGHWMRMVGTLAVVKDVEAYLASRPATPEPKVTEWKIEDFTADLDKAGTGRNLLGGQEIFAKLACVQCHKLGKAGYAYGPDLTDVLKRLKDDRAALLTEILEPSKIIADRYRNYVFELNDGDELVGMIVKEDADTVIVQTGPSDALVQPVKKSNIKQRTPQGSSQMPLGLLNLLTKEQILDLLAYVESGGNVPAHAHPR
jgi:putative heme-binding domain-containing protein